MTRPDRNDHGLRARLRATSPTPSLDAHDVDRLARAIGARIALDRGMGWRTDIVSLGRVWAPLAAAAGLAALILISAGLLPAPRQDSPETALAEALAGGATGPVLETTFTESAGWLSAVGE